MKNKFLKLKEKPNLALTLEGGGARGGYQIGAVKALYENGYNFKAIVGTSIGAINGAYLAQGDFDKLYKMWQTLSFKDLLDLENDPMKNLLNAKLNVEDIRYLSKKLGEAVKNGGLDITKEREILESTIDEEKLRNSDILYGLVAACLTDVKGEELFIDEIPQGKVVDYIIASSNLPFFKRSIIGDKKYLDGGIWDNCPVHMLEKKGFKDVIVIRAFKQQSRIRDYRNILKRGKITIHFIEPIDTLPSILNFDSENLNELIKLGYYDTLKILNGYDGFRYYFEEVEYLKRRVRNIPIDVMTKVINDLDVKLKIGKHIEDEFIKKVIPLLVSKTKVKTATDLNESVLAMVEHLALNEYIDRYKVYKLEELIEILKQRCNYDELSLYSKAMYDIVTNL